MAIYTLQPGIATQIVYAAASQRTPPITEYVIANLDQESNVYIGSADAAAQQPDLTADMSRDLLAPLQSVTVRATLDWWALNISDDPIQVDVIPEGISESASPIGTALAFLAAGIPEFIAQAITQSGISLVSAPTLLYGAPGGGGGGGTGGAQFIGARVDPKGYNPPPPAPPVYADNDFIDPGDFYDNVVGRTIAPQGNKWYWNEGQLETTLAQLTADWGGLVLWLQNTEVANPRLIASIKPDRTGVVPGGTLNAHGTSQAALLASMLGMLKANFANVTFIVTLWQEPQGNNNGVQFFPFTYTDGSGQHTITYVDYVKAYGPTVTAAAMGGFAYDPLASPQQYTRAFDTSFFTGTNVEGYTHYYVDYYATAYKGKVRLNAANGLGGPAGGFLSQAVANGLIFGIAEYGDSATGTSTDDPTFHAYISHIISVMSGLAAAQQGGDITWFSGVKFQGDNVILANGQNSFGVNLAGTPALPGITAVYDALSNNNSGPSSGTVTVPAGGSLNLTPIKPTPGGGYAVAGGLSYDISIIGTAGAGSTIPFVTFQLLWKNVDITGSKVIHEERWQVPLGASTSSGTIIFGRGPMHGQFLNIKVVNQDTVACTLVVQLNQTGRPVSEHDWEWDSIASVNVPGFTLPGSTAAYSNDLGDINGVSVPANGSISQLLSLYAGQVDCFFSTNAGPGLMTATLNPQPAAVFGSNAIVNQPISSSGTSPGPFDQVKIFPRGPVLVTYTNTDAAAHNVFGRFVALDRG